MSWAKIVTWSDQYFYVRAACIFTRFGLWAYYKAFVKWSFGRGIVRYSHAAILNVGIVLFRIILKLFIRPAFICLQSLGQCKTDMIVYHSDRKVVMTTFCHQWRHWRLSEWQISLFPVMAKRLPVPCFHFIDTGIESGSLKLEQIHILLPVKKVQHLEFCWEVVINKIK